MQLEQLLAQLCKLTGQNETADAEAVLVSIIVILKSRGETIATIKMATDHPDPTKFVPIAVIRTITALPFIS